MSSQPKDIRVMRGQRRHLREVVRLIRELAEFEQLMDDCDVTEDLLAQHLFGPQRAAELLVGRADGRISGYAIYFRNFSTFRGKPGLYLEDLYVTPSARGRGLGKALILEVARVAESRGCPRFEWVCLDWNRRALDFYGTLGAKAQPEWVWHRLEQPAIGSLARQGRP